MPEQVSKLFAQLAELADAEGAVPEDGSGIDGVWTTTVPAEDRDRDWTVAMNADTESATTPRTFRPRETTPRSSRGLRWCGSASGPPAC